MVISDRSLSYHLPSSSSRRLCFMRTILGSANLIASLQVISCNFVGSSLKSVNEAARASMERVRGAILLRKCPADETLEEVLPRLEGKCLQCAEIFKPRFGDVIVDTTTRRKFSCLLECN